MDIEKKLKDLEGRLSTTNPFDNESGINVSLGLFAIAYAIVYMVDNNSKNLQAAMSNVSKLHDEVDFN